METTTLFIFLSLIPAAVWCWFYIIFRDKRAVFYKDLVLAFLGGLGIAGIVIGIEKISGHFVGVALGRVLNIFSTSLEQIFSSFGSIIFASFLISFLVAFFEVGIQHLFLKKLLEKKKEVNKIIIGTQLAIAFAFGFAAAKNGFYFFQPSQVPENLFLFQSLATSLVYVLYMGVLGHFLTLSKFHKLYRDYFSKRGLLISFLFLGFSRFFLSAQLFYYTSWIIMICFGVLMKYLLERRDFEINLILRREVIPPIFHERKEIITYLFNEHLSFEEMKGLAFCPNCFIAKEHEWKACPYCGMKFK